MTRTKIISSILLVTILLVSQITAVGAAPAGQETNPITGTVESITFDTDAETGGTSVMVTLTVGTGATQTVRLSLANAMTLGLLTVDGAINPDALNTPVEIDPGLIIPDAPEETEEEAQHPVGSAISDFFFDLLGVDYETVMSYHDEGVGFVVIAQALWITNALDGDSETFAAIMEARQNNDYSAITLPDGSTPQNWGQFRKAVMHDREKAKENLGAIMSGRAEGGQGNETPTGAQSNGNGPDQERGNNGNNGNAPDKDKDIGNYGKDNDHGNNKDKNKDKDKSN